MKIKGRLTSLMSIVVVLVIALYSAMAVYANGGTQTFSYTGGEQTWVVPAGVTSVTIEAWGAQGGAGVIRMAVRAGVAATSRPPLA